MPSVGADFGDFHLVEVLGRGGMGVVYRATQRRLSRTVAVKVLAPRLADDVGYRDRFVREARTLSRLDSPHVIHVYDYGEVDGLLFIATQLVSGGDLEAMIRNGPLGVELAVEIADQVASALDDAHSVGVVHRDVKPSNVLLRAGSSPFAYLCDFGIAQTQGDGRTTTGVVVGTWAYLAPERCNGMDASASSDIYSLGCLLWTMIAGRPPFHGTDVQVAMAHVGEPVPQLAGDSPAETILNRILLRAMAKDPADRHRDAAELRSDLRRAADELRRTGPASSEVLRLPARAEMTQLREVSATPELPQGRRRSGERRTRGFPWLLVPVAAALVLVLFLGAFLLRRGSNGTAADPPVSPHSPAAASATASPTHGSTPKRSSDGRDEARVTRGSYDGDALSDVALQGFAGRDDPLVIASSGRTGFRTPYVAAAGLPGSAAIIHRLNGDFDGDGRTDAALLADRSGELAVSVRRSLNGRFAGARRWGGIPGVDSRTAFPVSGDFDGDGRMDLVAVEYPGQSTSVAVLRSTGHGFSRPRAWTHPLAWPHGSLKVVPGDFDADGRTDLVVLRDEGGQVAVQVLRSTGRGFEIQPPFTTLAGIDVMAVKPLAGDFDGDGTADFMAYVRTADGGAHADFFKSTRTGFAAPMTWMEDSSSDAFDSWISVGDYNGDGKWDVARLAQAIDSAGNRVRGIDFVVLLSSGAGLGEPRTWGHWDQLDKDEVRTLNRIG